MTEVAYQSIQNFSKSLVEIKREVNEINNNFEKMITNISLPYILEKQGLIYNDSSKLRLLYSSKMENYKDEVNKLNQLFNDFFSFIKDTLESLMENIKLISIEIHEIYDEIVDASSNYEEILKNIKNLL